MSSTVIFFFEVTPLSNLLVLLIPIRFPESSQPVLFGNLGVGEHQAADAQLPAIFGDRHFPEMLRREKQKTSKSHKKTQLKK